MIVSGMALLSRVTGLTVIALIVVSWHTVQVCHATEEPTISLYALVVGISKYKDSNYNLKLAAKDARDVHAFLEERKRFFVNVHAKLLLDENATRANILKALRKDFEPARPEDVVIIYLAGHGCSNPKVPDEYYFLPHDVDHDNLFGTAIMMNDAHVFKSIRSERILLVADSCMSEGFLAGLANGGATVPGDYFASFSNLQGRFGISAAGRGENAHELPKFGNGLFTFFFLKGLRGSAKTNRTGTITVREIFDYASAQTAQETRGRQNPQLYCAQGAAEKTPVYLTPVYTRGLDVKVKFFFEDETARLCPLTDESVLKSGQHVGIVFKPDADCYVHILWWDSSGQVGRLFPNPKLTQGTGFVRAGETCWLPSQGERHWYILDDKPGWETLYFVASRERNPKLEELYDQLAKMSAGVRGGESGKLVAEEIEREINLMGFADYTVPAKAPQSYGNREALFRELEEQMRVSGAEAFFKMRFKHTDAQGQVGKE
jgi:hypothetical protein